MDNNQRQSSNLIWKQKPENTSLIWFIQLKKLLSSFTNQLLARIRRSRLMVDVGPMTRRANRLHKIWDSILWHMKIVYLFLLDRNMVGRSLRPHFNIPLLPRVKWLSWNEILLAILIEFFDGIFNMCLFFEGIYSCI